MNKKLAKIKYLPNNFQIIEGGDHVIWAVTGKISNLDVLNYWNVDLQEPYYSYKEAAVKREDKWKWLSISNDCETKSTLQDFLKSFFPQVFKQEGNLQICSFFESGYLVVMSSSWNFSAQAEPSYESSEPSRAKPSKAEALQFPSWNRQYVCQKIANFRP